MKDISYSDVSGYLIAIKVVMKLLSLTHDEVFLIRLY